MSLLFLALMSLRNRWFSAFLCVLTIGLSSALLLAVEHIRASARSSFQSTVSGTDLIVGARTGAVPLMLYTVFHVGEASNNVSWASYQRYANLNSVSWTIPVSLGDSYRGFRVVGTTDAMFQHYRFGAKRALEFKLGQAFSNSEAQAVVGSADGAHDDHKAHDSAPPKAITAFFVGLKVRPMALALQRKINDDESEPLLAILPTATLQQLWQLVGVAEQALSLVSIAVVATGLLGMMMALIATLEQRRREMAILRSVGARGHQIFSLLLLESAALTLAGLAMGAAVVSVLLALFADQLASRYGLFLSTNWLSARTLIGLGLIFLTSVILAILPAAAAYRSALADGLSVKL